MARGASGAASIHGGGRASAPREDARQARPTGNRDDLVQPWLYAIVALVLVEDHAADRCAPTAMHMPASDV